MRVLVVAEGKHERSGALENLLKRLGGEQAIFEFERVSDNRIHAVHGKGRGYIKRALRWLMEAQKRGVDALILLIDEDGQRERIMEISDAQGSTLSLLPRALGVAIRTFDAWMLADEKALTRVLGYAVSTQPEPEGIRNPKELCMRLLADGPNQMAQSQMYAEVSCQMDLDVLCTRCPSGFSPFAAHVRAVFA